MRLFVDGDAFPNLLKPTLLKAIQKYNLPTHVFANKKISIGEFPSITYYIVQSGLDEADDEIVSQIAPEDLVITADIPLADRVIAKHAHAIDHRGAFFDKENIKYLLAVRNLMQEIRDSGGTTKGPAPFSKKDVHNFSTQLHNFLYKRFGK